MEASEIVDPKLKLTTSFVVSNRVVDNLKDRGLFTFLDRVVDHACATPGGRAIRLEKIATRFD